MDIMRAEVYHPLNENFVHTGMTNRDQTKLSTIGVDVDGKLP